MNINKLLTKLTIILFVLWLSVAVARTFYNFSKLFTEEKAWVGLSTEQQKEKQNPELHNLYKFIRSITDKESNILFITNSAQAYYLGRYYLYPTKLISKFEPDLWRDERISYDYLLVYPWKDRYIQREIDLLKKNYKLKKIGNFKYKNMIKAVIYKI